MAKYRSKPVIVEAVQWKKPGDHPAVVPQVRPNHPPETWAYVIDTDPPCENYTFVNKGEWVVDLGRPNCPRFTVLTTAQLRAKYEPFDDRTPDQAHADALHKILGVTND